MFRINLLIFFILSSISILSWGRAKINPNPLKARAYFQVNQLPQGANAELLIDLTLAEHHHAYDNQFLLSVESPSFLQLGQFKIAPLIEFHDKHSKKIRKGVEGFSTLSVPVGVPASAPIGAVSAQLLLTYQACTDEYCLLPKTINVPLNFSIISANEEFGLRDSTVKELTLAEKMQKLGLTTVFFLVFIAGLLTSFTPCVFPMIPITLAVIGNRAHTRSKLQNFLASLSYVLGIAITYSTLGLFAASTGALFGAYLGHPIFVGFISLVFLLMGISMFGFFELQIPNFIAQPLSRIQTGAGYFGAFFSGIIAGVVASPCVGPVLVSILTYVAQSGNLFIGFWLLFTFAMGLGLIFLIIGTSSSLLSKFPKSGSWMNKVKNIFGVVMIGMAFYFAWPLVKQKFFVKNPSATISNEKLNFQPYSDEKLQQALQQGRPVIIDFWADWCAACIELEKLTFTEKNVRSLGDKFTLLKFDATKTTTESFKALKKKYAVIGLPNLIFYDSKGTYRKDLTLTGFENAEQFTLRMKKALNQSK